ncbi:L-idonate 5-dehydrogenase [Pseudahrensia aquimaris]|uniref:L-idonate 5-dehydrogenase n=1 Tax=Pseudahrensia aquimaris TaxID=744461 RepID=A0ABW3FHT8_9HYPH
MKAIVIHAAHDLKIEDQEAAVPADGEVAVAIGSGGICGSDLHYYHQGGFGTVRLKEPMILGHEVAGTITALGAGVSALAVGDRVAVSPSCPCGSCKYCDRQLFNHCLNMRFYGSAMPFPHIQGAFRQNLIALASQCHKLDDDTPTSHGAVAEPLAVTLHACNRAGDMHGKSVLVTGCGPIGALAILAARHKGAAKITATDIEDTALDRANALGADAVINTRTNLEALEPLKAGKGTFDVMLEASGSEIALRQGLDVLRPRGVLVQLGLGGDISIPQNTIVAKEIDLRGTFRFHEEFSEAVTAINSGAIDVASLITHEFVLEDAVAAFEMASDRSQAMKVQIKF